MKRLGFKSRRVILPALAGLLMFAGTAQARPNSQSPYQNIRHNTPQSHQLPGNNQRARPLSSTRSLSSKWAQRKISASDAKAVALKRVPGAQVVDVKLEGKVYRVRVVQKDGRVIDVFVDAATGRVR